MCQLRRWLLPRYPIGTLSFQRHGQHQRGTCGHAADLVVRLFRRWWRFHHLLRRDRAVPALTPSGASSAPIAASRATQKAAPVAPAEAAAPALAPAEAAALALAPAETAVTAGRPL